MKEILLLVTFKRNYTKYKKLTKRKYFYSKYMLFNEKYLIQRTQKIDCVAKTIIKKFNNKIKNLFIYWYVKTTKFFRIAKDFCNCAFADITESSKNKKKKKWLNQKMRNGRSFDCSPDVEEEVGVAWNDNEVWNGNFFV